jgi:hypothetical protein
MLKHYKMKKFSLLDLLLFSLILILGHACSGNGNVNAVPESITVDLEGNIGKGNVLNLSSVVSKIDYIPLQTSSSSLVGDAKEIHFENGRLYLSSNYMIKGCQIFDSLGRHILYFNRTGRGPEEYPMSMQYDIHPDNGNIDILSVEKNKIIITYDSSGKFMRKLPLPGGDLFNVSPVLYINDSTYAAVITAYLKGTPEYSAILFSPGDSSAKYLMPIPGFQQKDPFNFQGVMSSAGIINGESGQDEETTPIGLGVLIYRYKDLARLVFPYNDTIFSISPDMKLETPFVILYGKTRFPGGEKYDRRNYVSMKSPLLESDDYLFLAFHLNNHAHEPYEKEIVLKSGRIHKYTLTDCYALLNKKTGFFTLLNQPVKGMPGFKEDILNGPPFWPMYVSSKGELVSFYSPDVLISWAEKHKVSPKLKKIIDNLDDSDNPVVVIAK